MKGGISNGKAEKLQTSWFHAREQLLQTKRYPSFYVGRSHLKCGRI